ncbi:hypothetical protein J6590_080467 [Homalodisca vitripennis]|nr:hypothetical protein J6590_080467 [Homalodisca vitripennis]
MLLKVRLYGTSQQDDADKDEETIFEDVQDIPSSSIPSTSTGRIIREKPSSASKQIPYAKPISRKVAGERLGKIQNAVQQLKDISDKVLAPERKKDMCEYELFGQFIASQLKKLPEINALAVMQKIQTCLMNERMTLSCISPSTYLQHLKFDAVADFTPEIWSDVHRNGSKNNMGATESYTLGLNQKQIWWDGLMFSLSPVHLFLTSNEPTPPHLFDFRDTQTTQRSAF